MGWFQKRFSSIKERSPAGLFVQRKHKHDIEDVFNRGGTRLQAILTTIDRNSKKALKDIAEITPEKLSHGSSNVKTYLNDHAYHIHNGSGLVKKLKKSVDALTKRVEALEKVKAKA